MSSTKKSEYRVLTPFSVTPYLQASADVSGGSSGSPVVTKDGFAVGLVAGGYENASTDLLLPLDRPLRALQSVQSGQSIRRGTIQSIWTLEKPAECRARGLSEHIIHKHSPDGSGLLVVNKILPEGPSDGKVKEGDVLLEVNGRNVTSLSEFEDFIDNAIEDDIKIRVQRSQNSLEFELSVQNFFKIAPCRLLEFAGATLQDLRFQTAMLYNVPIKGVFLPRATGSFCLDTNSDKLIDSIDHQPTSDLDAFIKITQKIPGKWHLSA